MAVSADGQRILLSGSADMLVKIWVSVARSAVRVSSEVHARISCSVFCFFQGYLIMKNAVICNNYYLCMLSDKV